MFRNEHDPLKQRASLFGFDRHKFQHRISELFMSETPMPAAQKFNEPIAILAERQAEGYRLFTDPDRLEQIGALLRGKPEFSFFYSIGLPILVTVATIVVSSGIQYLSWLNSIRLQDATAQASRAATMYDKAATTIGAISYSTFLAIVATPDLVNRKTPPTSDIGKFNASLDAQRLTAYYDQLTRWSEGYDELLTGVDFALDRPLLRLVGEIPDRNLISSTSLNKVDCTQSMPKQMVSIGLKPHALKDQLAVISHCLSKLIATLDGETMNALANDALTLDPKAKTDAESAWGDLNTMANVFRCNAQRRLEFLQSEKQYAVVTPMTVVRYIYNGKKARIRGLLSNVDAQCNS
jgi:hypothetical protein